MCVVALQGFDDDTARWLLKSRTTATPINGVLRNHSSLPQIEAFCYCFFQMRFANRGGFGARHYLRCTHEDQRDSQGGGLSWGGG